MGFEAGCIRVDSAFLSGGCAKAAVEVSPRVSLDVQIITFIVFYRMSQPEVFPCRFDSQSRTPILSPERDTRRPQACAGAHSLDNVGVQVKCPLLTSDRINEATARGKKGSEHGHYALDESLEPPLPPARSVGIGEIDRTSFDISDVCARGDLYSEMVSCSEGVVLANSLESLTRYPLEDW